MSVIGRTIAAIATRVSRALSGPATRTKSRRVRASYDAAQDTVENENHWGWADALNANAANSPDVRKRLRERARYEADNNGYLGGLIDKLGKDLVGRGPRPQLSIPGVSRDVTRRIERAFLKWSRAIGLAQKLRLLDAMAVRDGEGFALFVQNARLDPFGVQLDLRLYETDQVSTPFFRWDDEYAFDGGRIDDSGNVTEWHFLKAHPGSDVWLAAFLDYERIDAGKVVHWFNPRRAGQLRGVPEVQSSLTLFGYLRRFTLASLVAAETAANIAGVLETDAPVDDQTAPTFETMEDVDIPRGGLLTLPGGWKASAFKAEQPVTGYREYKGEILTEAGQPVGAPRNISTGSSAEYNYSSGRLDHGIYQAGIRVRRVDLRDRVLDRTMVEWIDNATVIPGLIPAGLPPVSEWHWEWYFDGWTSLDPVKDAQADQLNLANGTTTYAEICAEKGQDWEEVFEQRAREQRRAEELGITAYATKPAGPPPAPEPSDSEVANAGA